MNVTVLKLGGELIEAQQDLARTADAVAALARDLSHRATTLVIVHGGGRAIDAELARRGLTPDKRDGIRVTDEATLDAVVAVLAGTANTTLVAALGARGVRAVGLTGADAGLAWCERVTAMETNSGAVVDPGLVGRPIGGGDRRLLTDLCAAGYVPVIASIGATSGGAGELLNVNADVMAAHVASIVGAERLIVAGGTPGVLDSAGRRIDALDSHALQSMLDAGTATAGMMAKLRACQSAREAGVADVRIVDGRSAGFEQGTALR
ncbi:MAG: acetylglutamate kinase [Vicinamibacterales bacterium]